MHTLDGRTAIRPADVQTATQEAVGSIKMIGSTIGKIFEITSAISSAIEQQGAATQDLSGNIQRTADGTTQVAGTIAEGRQPDRRGIEPAVVIGKAIVGIHRQPAGRDRGFPEIDCRSGVGRNFQRLVKQSSPAPAPAGP
jgi:hypothetical protein